MLTITIPGGEDYDSEKNLFINYDPVTLTLEHSLIAISKWESKWHKPFFSTDKKTPEETIDYIRCMTLTPNVPIRTYLHLTEENGKAIQEYINDPMTATWFNHRGKRNTSSEVITSELIYYWMTAFQIPFECQKWHINRLLTLVQVCSAKTQEAQNPKKMRNRDILAQNRALNMARRSKMHSKG